MTTLLELGRQGLPLTDYDIIDMHCHLGRARHAAPDISPKSLVRVMDRIGVKACVCSHTAFPASQTRAANDVILEGMHAHPGRILGYVRPWPDTKEGVRAEIERCLDAGFTGIKLHNTIGFPYDDAAYEPAYEIAHERKLPMLFHTWGGEAEFEQIDRMAERYPHPQMILGHAGATHEQAYIDFARDHANVTLELCLSLSPRGLVKRLVDAVGPERIVWGSDALFINMAQQIGKVLGADVDENAKKMILSENAKRILSTT